MIFLQSELRPGEPEPQILEYQTQQLKLFPSLALVMGFSFAAESLWAAYEEGLQSVEEGDMDALADLHAASCGLKALVSFFFFSFF